MNDSLQRLGRPRVGTHHRRRLDRRDLHLVTHAPWRAGGRRAASAAAAIGVDVATVARGDVPGYLEGLGTVQAFYTVKVTARVDGQLDRVAFTEGETLKKGQLLAQIDPRPFQAALDQALAQRAKDAAMLTNTQRDMDRYLLLAPQDLASKQTVDTQRAAVSQAEAQLKGDDATIENARTQLSYTTITAPISGRTGIRLVDPGNIVHAADTHGHRGHDADPAHLGRVHLARGCRATDDRGPGSRRAHRGGAGARQRHGAGHGHRDAARQPDRPDHRHHPRQGHLPEYSTSACGPAVS